MPPIQVVYHHPHNHHHHSRRNHHHRHRLPHYCPLRYLYLYHHYCFQLYYHHLPHLLVPFVFEFSFDYV